MNAAAPPLNLSWLINLRWGAIAGQFALIVVAQRYMGSELPMTSLGVLVAVGAASNLLARRWLRGGPRGGETAVTALMVLDVLLLTGLLHLSGGPFNPFSILYLVNIALATVVLPGRRAWGLLALSLLCFGMLFIEPVWFPSTQSHAAHMHQMDLHLRGMWLAFGVAAFLIVYFVQRVTSALARRDEELARARAQAQRTERLASLATLAAGAAHELSTPLSTIAVVAQDQAHRIAADARLVEFADDARLIRAEVERCRAILSRMAADAGQSAGEALVAMTAQEWVQAAVAATGEARRFELRPQHSLVSPTAFQAPRNALVQALHNVLRNALQASPPEAPVAVEWSEGEGRVAVEVVDRGAGMPAETAARVGEPFFTTRAPGEGMGLGLFLARTVAERLGGGLELRSHPGAGTSVRLWLSGNEGTRDANPSEAVAS